MRLFLFIIGLAISIPQARAYDWGQTGHRVTGEVAEQYLSKKARKAIAELLDGESLEVTSTYADEIKSDNNYRSYGAWHYVNIPFDKTYDTHPVSDRGDLVTGIEKCVEVLKSEFSSKEDKAFHLRLLVHFIGDLHQPMHTGLSEDKGGNDFQVQWFGSGTNLHSVWDTKMIESYGMSYTELAATMPDLSKRQVKSLQEGSILDWVEDSRTLVKKVYATTKSGDTLGYRYMYDYFETVRDQLQKGGIRLAGLLNEILG